MDKPWKVIAAFIGVFVAGAVFGGFFVMGIGSRLVPAPVAPTPALPPVPPVEPSAPATAEQKAPTPPQAQPKSEQPKPAQPPQARPPLIQVPFAWQEPQLMRRYADRLDLTGDQKNKINPVIQRALEDYRRLQQNQLRETSIIVQRMQTDIRKELTPDQIAELDKMEQRQREIMQKAEQRQRDLQKAEQQKKKAPGAQKGLNEKRQMKSAPAQPAPAPSAATPSESSSATSASSPSASSATSSSTSAETTSAVVTPTK